VGVTPIKQEPDVAVDERELVARATDGDVDAFYSLISRHDHGLRGLAYRLLGDRDAMDDALQESYLKAFRALPGFSGDSTFKSWLYRIVYNTCLDELRRIRKMGILPIESAAGGPINARTPGTSPPRRSTLRLPSRPCHPRRAQPYSSSMSTGWTTNPQRRSSAFRAERWRRDSCEGVLNYGAPWKHQKERNDEPGRRRNARRSSERGAKEA
jgi:RNA polymerase sigma factor (sigma-70 family)